MNSPSKPGGPRRRPARVAALLLVLLLAALAAPALGPGAPATARAADEWEKVVVLYHSDVGGKTDPCG